jgi:hypothetical protein
LLGERDGHVGIYHSSQSLQHFVYAVHQSVTKDRKSSVHCIRVTLYKHYRLS